MSYEDIITKHAKKFVGNDKKTPILNGIHYAADGTVYATDRHQVLRIRNAHNFKEPITLHAKTGTPISGTYPDVEKVLSKLKFSNVIYLGQMSELNQAVLATNCALAVASELSKVPMVQMTVENGVCYLNVIGESINLKAFFGNALKADSSQRTLNPRYLANALGVFADKLERASVYVKIGDPNEPILVTDDKDIDVVILPFRTV